MKPAKLITDLSFVHTTDHPGMVVGLLDASGSMNQMASDVNKKKCVVLEDSTNQVLRDLALASRRGEEYVDRCLIGMYAFSGDSGEKSVLQLQQAGWPRTWDKAAYGTWIKIHPCGRTPMAQALTETAQLFETWYADDKFADRFIESPPPIVMVCTDGGANDLYDARRGRQTRAAAERLWGVRTPCGDAPLIFPTLISTAGCASPPVRFPTSDNGLNDLGKLLYDIASFLPTALIETGRNYFDELDPAAPHVGLIVNGQTDDFIRLLRLGTATYTWARN